jgi:hypothetical protein
LNIDYKDKIYEVSLFLPSARRAKMKKKLIEWKAIEEKAKAKRKALVLHK